MFFVFIILLQVPSYCYLFPEHCQWPLCAQVDPCWAGEDDVDFSSPEQWYLSSLNTVCSFNVIYILNYINKQNYDCHHLPQSHRHEIHKSHNKAAAQWELREKALKSRLKRSGSPALLDQTSLSIIREVCQWDFKPWIMSYSKDISVGHTIWCIVNLHSLSWV